MFSNLFVKWVDLVEAIWACLIKNKKSYGASFKVALKFIKIPQTDYGIPKNIIRECGLLKILDHSNVMKVIEIIMQRQ